MNMAFAFEYRASFLGEQRNEPYERYGKVSSATKNVDPMPKALSGKRLCRLAGKGGA